MKKKVLFTGGGSGGHIYPLIAVAEKLNEIGSNQIKISYMGPRNESHHHQIFKEGGIKTYNITPAKFRRYFDLRNIIDIPKFIFSLFEAWFKLFFIMPDIIFSKGGPGALAVVIASKFYFIPVVIHESDSVPSLTSKITSKIAKRIGISFEETRNYFPPEKTFLSGNPVRDEMKINWTNQNLAKASLDFKEEDPVMLVLGGSQGAESINNFITEGIDILTKDFQIYHQTGDKNVDDVNKLVSIYLKDNPEKRKRYKAVGTLTAKEMKLAFNAADIVLSRAGAGSIFEISLFGKPSILVPLIGSANDHQKKNAYAYAETGAAIVIEEPNLKASIVAREAREILDNEEILEKMKTASKRFSNHDATEKIIREILNIIN